MGGSFSYTDVVPTLYNWYHFRDVTPASPLYQDQISSVAKNVQNCLSSGDPAGFQSYLKYFDVKQRKTIVSYKIDGVNCVYIACIKNDCKSMDFLLDQCGIAPNMKLNTLEDTPLHIACKRGKTEIAQCLIDHGANYDLLNKFHQSCLQLSEGNEEMCRLLISNGVDVNLWKGKDKLPMIFEACKNEKKDLVNFLVKHKAEMNIKDEWGLSPIEVAAHFYLSKSFRSRYNEMIHSLVGYDGIPESAKIKALEVIGCERIKRYLLPVRLGPMKSRCLELAKNYWQQALTLRLKGQPQGHLEESAVKSQIFKDVQKCRSFHELDQIFTDKNRILMESVFIMENTYGILCHHTVLFLKHLAQRYVEKKLPEEGIRIFNHVFEFIMNNISYEAHLDDAWINEFQFTLIYWVRFHELINEDEYTRTYDIITWFLDKLIFSKNKENFKPLSQDNVASIFIVLKYIAGWKDIYKREQYLKTIISKLANKDIIYRDQSLLHYCVHAYSCWVGQDGCRRLKCMQLIQYLLQYGMSPDIVDKLGDTPLMTIIKIMDYYSPEREEIIRILIEFSHVDMLTSEGQSALLLLKAKDFLFSEVSYRTLQCLAASVIVKENIPYKNIVPECIASFIEMH